MFSTTYHKSFTSFFLFLCFAVPLTGQSPLQIGGWQEHLPFRSGTYLTQSADKIFFATEFAILEVDKGDRSTRVYTKINSLTDVGPGVIRYHPAFETLIISYVNGNIDLLTPNGVVNLPFIKLFDNPGDKTIYDITIDGDAAFISTGFGMARLNMNRQEFEYTTFTGNLRVNSLVRWKDDYYIGTPEGIYRAPVNGLNLADFNEWQLMDEMGFPPAMGASSMAVFNDRLYMGMEDGLYRYDGSSVVQLLMPDSAQIRYLTAEGDHLLIGLERLDYPGNFRPDHILRFDANEQVDIYPTNCADINLYAIEDEVGTVWFADQFQYFRVSSSPEDPCQRFDLNTPHTGFINRMEVAGDNIWLTSGGIQADQNYLFRSDGFYGRIEGTWKVYNPFNTPALAGLRDFYDIAVHPENGTIYASAFFEGLAELKDGNVTVYDDSNSSLNNAIGDDARTRCAGLDFDSEQNLWICNHAGVLPVSVLKNDGSWQSFDMPGSSRRYIDVMVDDVGNKWFVLASSVTEPIVIMDTGADLDDTSDDRFRILNTNNSALPTGDVTSIITDLDGIVWVGTTEGVVVFPYGTAIMESTSSGVRPIVEQDGIPAYLLETETINTIAIDGSNRKWFGTNNGVFLQSADGQEQIAHFNTGNSPLLNNQVIDIAINQESGEVFIGTASGLQSLKGEATSGGPTHKSEIKVYPNPVRPSYDGPIAIKGLAQNANVKITDVSGRLVYETTALGGQATWNGKDYNGRRAASGVYLVFSTYVENTFYSDKAVAEIILLN